MRAIDYLQSRDDIMADKIGCTGNSGGGTLTSYLMALDDRIVAAAPGGFLMTFRAPDRYQWPAGRRAEHPRADRLRHGRSGLRHHAGAETDAHLRSTRDKTFPIEGTWPLFREAKRFYTRLRHPERVDLTEPDAPHGFTLQTREATVQWMRRWLLGIDDVVREIDELPEPMDDNLLWKLSDGDWTDQELQCTAEGQVLLMPGEKSVFQLNAELEQELHKDRTAAWQQLTAVERRDLVRKTIAGLGARGRSFCRDAHLAPTAPDLRVGGHDRARRATRSRS